MQTILVTGATGFLGSHIVRSLCEKGYRVKALRRTNSLLSKLQGLENKIEWLNTETSSDETFERFFSGVDAVIHTATNYGRGGQPATALAETNTLFALKVLTAAINQAVALFINTDSSLPKETNAYSLSKAHFSEWGKILTRNKKTFFLNIRLEHVYGPGDDEVKFIDYVINSCLENQPAIKLTAGIQKRDFVYISDVVNAYLLLLQKKPQFTNNYMDLPLGSSSVIAIHELVKKIHQLTQSTGGLCFGAIPTKDNEVMYSCADISILKQLGWAPQIKLEEGLRFTIESKKQ